MRQPAYHQILPMILMTILLTSISLAKCPRVISKHGQEGLTGDVITQLAKHGRVSITKDGNVTSNRYEGAPYYLISVSYCKYTKGNIGCNKSINQGHIHQGRETLWNNKLTSPLNIEMVDKTINMSLNPAMKKLSEEPIENFGDIAKSGHIVFDGEDTEQNLCYYHYRPAGAPDIDNVKIQIAIAQIEPGMAAQWFKSFESSFARYPTPPEIRGKNQFISFTTTNTVYAAKDLNSFRINQKIECPHIISQIATEKNRKYLFNDVYTALAQKGSVYLTDDGKIDKAHGRKYYLRYVLSCNHFDNTSQQCVEANGYTLSDKKSGQSYLQSHPLSLNARTGYLLDHNRLGLVGGITLKGHPLCVYRYKNGQSTDDPSYFPVHIGISTENPEFFSAESDSDEDFSEENKNDSESESSEIDPDFGYKTSVW